MNVASLGLSIKLYQLSGWDQCDYHWHKDGDIYRAINSDEETWHGEEYICPAYDLGFLLRKVPGYIRFEHKFIGKMTGLLAWEFYHSEAIDVVAKAPEDAACKVAIELFNQGILTKEAA